MKAGAFNQGKALVGAFSMIVKTGRGTDGALHSTRLVLAPLGLSGIFLNIMTLYDP